MRANVSGAFAAVRQGAGEQLWQIMCLDLDPEAGKFGRSSELKVKIAAPVQPVLPESTVPGYPPAVEFADLVLTPYIDSQKCKGATAGAHNASANPPRQRSNTAR